MATRIRTDFRKPIYAVDVVLFTLVEGRLRVLIGRRENEPFLDHWGLIGGLLDPDLHENIEQVARVKLRDKTGVDARYLEQLRTYGSNDRSPRGWEVSTAYIALLPASALDLAAIEANPRLKLAAVQGSGVRPALTAFDHPIILTDAICRLRAKLEYSPIGAYLLPDEFTIPELQQVYEAVLGAQFSAKAFRHQLELAQILEAVPGQVRLSTGGRGAQLYRLRPWEREMPLFFPRQLKLNRAG